ncbi:MAG: MBL fold metallo-hydrolase [Proteobacteria bacterium]|nr:MBL fold metallo-hydrolase [Pseudomonadota bacterium]
MKTLEYLKITILCENIVSKIFGIGEHGFSAFIETDIGSYLFDTGSGLSILYNAAAFKKDLGKVKKIFLSHGHYDHTGGLISVLDVVSPIDVHCHPSVFDEKFKILKNNGKEYREFIGIPQRQILLETKGISFKFSKDFQEIEGGIFLTGEIPRLTHFEETDKALFVKNGAAYTNDDVIDDQALILSTKKGVVVLLGCAHAGIINTLWHIAKSLRVETFYAVIGGTHLGSLTEEQLMYSIDILKQIDIKILGVSHCTGLLAAQKLFHELGNKCTYASAGSVFEFS